MKNRFLIHCSKRQSGRCLIILALALRRKLVCGMSTTAQYVGTADSSVLNGSIHSIIICSYCHDYHNILPRAIPSAPAVMITTVSYQELPSASAVMIITISYQELPSAPAGKDPWLQLPWLPGTSCYRT